MKKRQKTWTLNGYPVERNRLAWDFSPVMSLGDTLLVRFDGPADNPGNIDMTLPELPAPYTFVPVVTGPDRTPPVFDAVFHQGQQELLSGELRCELTALTPLFVGHFQYKVKDRGDVTEAGQHCRLNQDWGPGLAGHEVSPKKHFLEPLFIGKQAPTNAKVVIPGASLKGMVRHNIGAMLGAPMERVQEQYFSYRPNLGISRHQNHYKCKAAVIDEINPDGSINIRIFQLDDLRNDINFHPGNINVYAFTRYEYAGGLDKGNRLNKTPNGTTPVHHYAWIRQNTPTYPATIEPEIVQQYNKTQDELADLAHGHLSRRDDIKDDEKQDARQGLLKTKQLRPNQLIFVETDENDRIVSFGHNFRYRWRYADSILTKDLHTDQARERVEVTGPPEERMTAQGGKLTGARLLFGYVDGAEDQRHESKQSASENTDSKKPTCHRDLKVVAPDDKESDAARLAGRIAINAAVEQCEPADLSRLDQRFISRSGAQQMAPDNLHRYTIPLKILASPKASAVEHYLQQPTNHMKTYGDLPGVPEDDTAGFLNGRKFYRHQNQAAHDHGLFEDTSQDNVASEHSAFAQFISKPGTKFRFTLRFKDLRPWELGAILLALNPDYKKRLEEEAPRYANKLGHGRPLGLGSVAIRVASLHLLDADGQVQEWQDQAADGSPQLNDEIKRYLDDFDQSVTDYSLQSKIDTWLSVLDFAHHPRAAYPNSQGHIYTYHTNIRARYSINRRNRQAMPENFGDPVKPD